MPLKIFLEMFTHRILLLNNKNYTETNNFSAVFLKNTLFMQPNLKLYIEIIVVYNYSKSKIFRVFNLYLS